MKLTSAGEVWGSAAQKAAIKKATEASALKRQKMYCIADVPSGARLRTAAPSSRTATAQRLTKAVRDRPKRLGDGMINVQPTQGPPTIVGPTGGGIQQSRHDQLASYDDSAVRARDKLSSHYDRTARKGDSLFRHKS